MTNSLATLPVFNANDIANARAYHRSLGEPTIGVRGRMPVWALLDWHRALRPVVASESNAKRRSSASGHSVAGKRGRRSTVVVDGTHREVTKRDSQMARLWAIANELPVPVKGRLSSDILQGWVNAGMPTFRDEKATVYYRAVDKLGRPNGKERIGIVYADMLPGGKPRMVDYWYALGIDNAIPIRITTNAMIINVTPNPDYDPENGKDKYLFEWVSKSDSRTVVEMLKGNVKLKA